MKNKKKTYKWIIWSFVAAFLGMIGLVIFILIYAAGYQDSLRAYKRSVENLEEVNQVLEFSEYAGLETYFVAIVERIDDEQYVYFVNDGIVAYQFPVDDLITIETARGVAVDATESQRIIGTQLGIYEETPIYEVRIKTPEGMDYVFVDAMTRDIMLHFTLD